MPSLNPAPASPTDSPATADEATRRGHPYRAYVLRAALGLLVVGLLLRHYDAKPVLAMLGREKIAYFAAAVVIYLSGQLISALRWRILALMVGISGRYREFVAYCFVGMFTNLFLPGLIGGDAARAFYLGRRCGRLGAATAATVADRGSGLLALFWLAGACALLPIGRLLPKPITTPVIAVAGLTILGYVFTPLIASLLQRIPGRIATVIAAVLPYLNRPASLIPAIVLSFALQVLLAIGQYALAVGLGLGISLWLLVLCVPIANVFASLPLTINGLGVRESAYVVLLGSAGMRDTDAIALGLLWFACTTVAGLVGGVVFVSSDLPKIRLEKEPRSD